MTVYLIVIMTLLVYCFFIRHLIVKKREGELRKSENIINIKYRIDKSEKLIKICGPIKISQANGVKFDIPGNIQLKLKRSINSYPEKKLRFIIDQAILIAQGYARLNIVPKKFSLKIKSTGKIEDVEIYYYHQKKLKLITRLKNKIFKRPKNITPSILPSCPIAPISYNEVINFHRQLKKIKGIKSDEINFFTHFTKL